MGNCKYFNYVHFIIVQTFELTNFKVWTVLSTEENVLLRGLLPEMSSFVPSAITRPFFELQTPDFVWKFVWTVPTNYKKKELKHVKVWTPLFVLVLYSIPC